MPSKSKKCKSTLITVEQMVDIALGNPEIGAVNFNVLHALLHVIIQQLNIQRCLVEFKGSDSERMEGIIMTAKPGPILKITEYLIDLVDGRPCNTDRAVPVPPTAQGGPSVPSGKAKSLLEKFESKICAKGDEGASQERTARVCDCGPPERKKEKRRHGPDSDTGDEKYDRSKEDDEGGDTAAFLSAPEQSESESKQNRPANPTDSSKPAALSEVVESEEKDWKNMSKKERCKEKKLAKRRKREEEELAALAEAEAREGERLESELGEKKDFDAAGGKKTKPCSCKEGQHKPGEVCPDLKLKAASSSYYGSETEGTCQTIIRVEPIGERCDTWRTRPALAHESLVLLEERVTLLQDAFEALENMPTNEELMKKTTGAPCVQTPVKDMWQLYNLNKRVESCEGAIEKLASMIEDVVKETCNFREAMMVIADAVDSMECNEETCENRASPCCKGQSGQPNKASISVPQTPQLAQNPVKQEVIAFPLIPPNPCGAFQQAAKPVPNMPSSAGGGGVSADVGQEGNDFQDVQMMPSDTFEQDQEPGLGPDFFKLSNGEKFCVLKESIECLMCQFKSFTDVIPLEQLAAKLCTIVTMQKQLDALQKEWEQYLQSFSDNGVKGTVDYIKELRTDIEDINLTIQKLMEDRKLLEQRINGILQEIDLLKQLKADKETMEDLLAEKADAALVNRKVSHDQFDAACDDLTKGLDDALERLIAQEALWNEAMEELQKDMENKLDKLEIMPLKEFINKKLKGLQEKLKQLAQLRKDAEAAGAKSKILRNLNCIACDNDVIMRMENKSSPPHASLPPSRSTRPYIAYELDQVRKALKKNPCRIQEEPEVQKKNIGLPQSRELPDKNKMDHYCNRYCGGSHTITTPQQRVTRIGHFLTEFGPQAMAMFNQDTQECKPVQTGNTTTVTVAHKDVRLG